MPPLTIHSSAREATPMFNGLPRPHDASAICKTLVLHVPRPALETVLGAHPAYWRNFGLLMAQKIRISFENNEAMILLPAAQRLASRLLLIAGGYGGINAEQSRIKLSQDTLAPMVSLTRQTTNPLLKNLESQGIVDLKFGEIVILALIACALPVSKIPVPEAPIRLPRPGGFQRVTSNRERRKHDRGCSANRGPLVAEWRRPGQFARRKPAIERRQTRPWRFKLDVALHRRLPAELNQAI
ncbi:Crp/Fnr family transcriptional regulator [Burkholderia sp. IMCC1007]|uniref:Crp/Fnr family transcriptional regulator n=1 Tax=Burkholderia sp. IMCC1007 TaxID=3004104 RepID=UPI0022B52DA0|nr:Crp/Fnr family transcriptional regulator [Burkholderia sp. IMCC1007]